MIDKTDAEIGQIVHLRPQTKAAPRECYQRLAAKLISVSNWPTCSVWVIALNKQIQVHRDNIGLHPHGGTTKKSEGDGSNSDPDPVRVKPAFRPHKPLSPGGYEEPMLF